MMTAKKEKIAILFIGIQGCGKSWYYDHFLAQEFEHINLDALHTRNKERIAIEEAIFYGRNIVIDNTNPTKEDRQRYIPTFRAAGYRIEGYFFESRVQDCIRRNAQRTGKARVPNAAIAATSNKLELPSKEEGFDSLYFIAREGETIMKRTEWRE